MIISRTEKILLSAIIEAEPISLIRLRSTLGWEVTKFSKAFISLENKGYIIREGAKAKLSENGIKNFHIEINDKLKTQKNSYKDIIKAPQLDVSLPYLPNFNKFMAAKRKNLYTRGASVVI